MAEELGFQEIDGNGAAIDGHEGFIHAGRRGMDGLGDELLAGAAFADDENRGAGRGHLRDQIQNGNDAFAFTDDVREIVALLERALELDVFFAQPPAFDGREPLAPAVRHWTRAW